MAESADDNRATPETDAGHFLRRALDRLQVEQQMRYLHSYPFRKLRVELLQVREDGTLTVF